MKKKILLASASPRRYELLSQIGLPFSVLDIDSSETEAALSPDDLAPPEFALKCAEAKLHVALQQPEAQDAIIICADTIVSLDGGVFGKPRNPADAVKMLRALSGRKHQVITGVAIACGNEPGKKIKKCMFAETTDVEFRKLTDGMIDAYVATGEPFDKAGAYGIQNRAAAFTARVCGCYANVVGLPISRVAETLEKVFNIPPADYWNRG